MQSLGSRLAIEESPIGQAFPSSTHRLAASALASVAIGVDLAISTQWWGTYGVRAIWAMIWCGLLVGLADGNLDTLGLRLRPVQGYFYWMRLSIRLALAVAVMLLVTGLVLSLAASLPEPVTLDPRGPLWPTIVFRCVYAPIQEEAVYRLMLCVGFAGLIGRWSTVALSGIVFGYLHVLYGNPSPENLIGGAILAWTFFQSRSLLIPVLLHSGGNGLITACHVLAWYWLNS